MLEPTLFPNMDEIADDSPRDFVLTREFIMSFRTPNGGFTRQTLGFLGVNWPPKKGWINRVVGTRISRKTVERLVSRHPASASHARSG